MRIDDGHGVVPGGANDMFRLDGRAGGDTAASGELTTAETLVLGVLAAHKMLGAEHTTLSRNLWVKPQLDSLCMRELLTWAFDEESNFRIIATDRLMSVAQTLGVSARCGGTSPTSAITVIPCTTATLGAHA